jgi:hypothetical protein
MAIDYWNIKKVDAQLWNLELTQALERKRIKIVEQNVIWG